MDFRFSDDQLTLAESVRDYLAGTHGPEVLRRLDAEGNRDPAIWQGLADMGLTGLLVPEAQGGLGMGLVEAALIAAECGRACLAEPLVDSAFVGVPWLVARGQTDGLDEVVAGTRRIAVPHPINPWLADSEGAALTSVDPLRNLAVAEATEADDLLLNVGALMSAAQLVGLSDAMLSQAVEYAKVRTQFGQPVGAFQGLKHQLASCSVAIEFAKPVVWRAAQALQDGLPSAPVHVSHAKLAASDAAMLTAETAIQVHGAMGYTYEVDLHFWMKRSWALCGAWGDRAFHYHRVEEALLGGAQPIGPEHTFA
ncbi:acyl-CoA dehydrogenase family protein [Novosphingobium sp.]|uniref:acyl-CoA dehydrogenase family protein n=1 Tax=Novosphingobium sp. TaxID=1874826 RepID=UPI001EB4D5CB|nr:acyl-CoA dehydrogenase family protein [Novosphingobium sp.]MBK6802321.1 acyl-CoA dehydrogenase family protein [Novosphingobium sp.]MBK9009621.1 acyl-CoA dehydrogenase family protein [Novosphingobium sp.]